MIVHQKVVLRLFTARLPAVRCSFVATWYNLIWLSSLLAKADEIQSALKISPESHFMPFRLITIL